MKFYEAKAGKWIQPVIRAYKIECCDCGLVHSLHFRIRKGQIQYKAYRDEKLTRQERRGKPMKNKELELIGKYLSDPKFRARLCGLEKGYFDWKSIYKTMITLRKLEGWGKQPAARKPAKKGKK